MTNIINGTAGNDTLSGSTDTSNTIKGLDGNDYIEGRNHGDSLDGGSGNDSLVGFDGDDLLDGGAGNDSLYGGGGTDTLTGGDGDELLDSGDRYDAANKVWVPDLNGDLLQGGNGNDSLSGNAGHDTLDGGSGDDFLVGFDGDDLLDGGAGNDNLTGGGGTDTLMGGNGDDRLDSGDRYDAVNKVWVPDLNGDLLQGGNGNDSLNGSAGNDTLDGGSGNDFLAGFDGDDTLIGGSGIDLMLGGAGNDTYYIDHMLDAIPYDDSGEDTAIVSTNFVKLPSTIEKIIYVDGAQPLPYWIDAVSHGFARYTASASALPELGTNYFAFPDAPLQRTGEDDGFYPIPENHREFLRSFFKELGQTVAVTFTETKDVSRMEQNSTLVFSGTTLPPERGGDGGERVRINKSLLAANSPVGIPMHVYAHEVGHVLGLKHTFYETAVEHDVVGPFLPATEDNYTWSVMSYTHSPRASESFYSPFDIAVLQYFYGVNPSARSGDSTYAISLSSPNFIWDGAGIDTLDASSISQPVTLFLEPGYWGHVSAKAATISAAGQVTINFGSVIENAIGGQGNDMLTGNDAPNVLTGGAGNDQLSGGPGDDSLDGGEGIDLALFDSARRDYEVRRMGSGDIHASGKQGNTDKDVLAGIERLAFSDGHVAFDFNGSAGIVAKILGAVFGVTAVKDKTMAGIGLSLADEGMAYEQLVEIAINEKLGANATAGQVVDLLYSNVMGSLPDPALKQVYVGLLEAGSHSVGALGLLASDSMQNATRIGLVGLLEDGLDYIPYG